MKKETKDWLGKIMTEYKQALEEANKKKSQGDSDVEALLSTFQHVKKDVIRPVMEDVGEGLKTYGHDYLISDEPYEAHNSAYNPWISMEIFPAGKEWQHLRKVKGSAPSITFKLNHAGLNVWVIIGGITSRSSSGYKGDLSPTEEHAMGKIDSDFVENRIRALLRKIFGLG